VIVAACRAMTLSPLHLVVNWPVFSIYEIVSSRYFLKILFGRYCYSFVCLYILRFGVIISYYYLLPAVRLFMTDQRLLIPQRIFIIIRNH